MSLLAHRGASRRRKPSPWQTFLGTLRATIAGARRRDVVGGRAGGRAASRDRSAGLAVIGLAFLCVAVGYALGSAFPLGGRAADQSGLRVGAGEDAAGQPGFEPGVERGGGPGGGRPAGIAPGPIGERQDLQPLASSFLLTAAYRSYEPASAAAQRLRGQGLVTARPHRMQVGDGTVFGLVVYFDGAEQRQQALEALQAVPAPDATFEHFRKTQKGWPVEGPIR